MKKKKKGNLNICFNNDQVTPWLKKAVINIHMIKKWSIRIWVLDIHTFFYAQKK